MKLLSAFLALSSAQTIEPTTTTSLGSTWNPFKCSGDCGCCCKPENRPYCKDGVWLSDAWKCSSGDYLLWEGVKSWVGVVFEKTEAFDDIKSAGECRSKCDQLDWCNGFQFDSNTMSCTIVDTMKTNQWSPVTGLIAGMKCDHTPIQTPEEDPSDHLWSSCSSHYQSIEDNDGFMPGAFVPDCKKDGSWEEMQCWGSTGYCWCVNEYGEKIPGSEGEDRGPVECGNGKDKNVKKVERLSSEINQILKDNMKRATQLTKRVSKMADKTVNYYEKNKSKCNFESSNDSDADSAREGNACGEVKKRFNRWKTWINTFNVCNGKEKFAVRMKKQLGKIQTKSNSRMNCE